jgi:nitrous oxidase accessory protein NosD
MHKTMRLTSPARAALVTGALVCAGLALPAQGAAASTAVNCATDSLQTAINNAADGATLGVTGWCQGNFDIVKDVTIVGTPGAVLSADDSGNVMGIGAPLPSR